MIDSRDLIDIVNASSLKITENLFRSRYIPLLLDPDPAKFNMAWLNEVAKIPHARVFITDNEGKVLFTVPPLRRDPIAKTNASISDLIGRAEAERKMYGAVGERNFSQSLLGAIEFNTVIDPDYAAEWRVILDRYKLSDHYTSIEQHQAAVESEPLLDADDDW